MLGITNIFLGQKLNNCKKDQKQPPVVKFYRRNTILTLSVTSWSPPASSEQPHESGIFFKKNKIFQNKLFDKISTFQRVDNYVMLCVPVSDVGATSQCCTIPCLSSKKLSCLPCWPRTSFTSQTLTPGHKIKISTSTHAVEVEL